MSALIAWLPVPLPLAHLQARALLAVAERAVDRPFTWVASRQLDRALVRYEREPSPAARRHDRRAA